MALTNRQWVLAHRPAGSLQESDFSFRETPAPLPDLASGEVLLRNLWLGFDATQREWLKDQDGYLPPVAVGEVMRASSVAEVVSSAVPALPEGSLVQGLYGWQDYALARLDDPLPPTLLPPGVTAEMALAALGGTALTAYFGLIDVGGLSPTDTVVVSAAGGATGSMAIQIARLRGARVIGIAGGATKCAWVKSLGAEDCIDYRSQNLDARLAALCPRGIDLVFDNVGGEQLEAMIAHIAHKGRVVLCGQISGYDAASPPPGPRNLINLVYRRARLEGFLMLDYLHRTGDAFAEIGPWLAAGQLQWKADIQHGFARIPQTLLRLFSGENLGKQLLRIDHAGEPQA